jgi:hypothetical protein
MVPVRLVVADDLMIAEEPDNTMASITGRHRKSTGMVEDIGDLTRSFKTDKYELMF